MCSGRIKKDNPIIYYIKSVWRSIVLPRFVRRWQRKLCLRRWERRSDADVIKKRVDYYYKLDPEKTNVLSFQLEEICKIKLKDTHSRYWFDLMRYLRSFDKHRKAAIINGDTFENPDYPVLAKARRLDVKASNCVLLNMDSLRHFTHVEDYIPFEEKKDQLIFRGEIYDKPHRIRFFEMWANNHDFDLGDTSRSWDSPWKAEKISIPDHFKYKYVLLLEGNDVATATQWVFESNCVPVMTKPTVESWLMHGAMIPGVHYIEIKSDFSDVAEKIAYYNAHPEEAKLISEASKEWIRQFNDPRRESIISYLVADRYLTFTSPRQPASAGQPGANHV